MINIILTVPTCLQENQHATNPPKDQQPWTSDQPRKSVSHTRAHQLWLSCRQIRKTTLNIDKSRALLKIAGAKQPNASKCEGPARKTKVKALQALEQ